MNYDVIVIGAGHAGCEAAAIAARMGASVALITHRACDLGQLSCNPAIGGIGKGHLVREIDALDGIMGKAADAAAIHYRLLNRTKGAAVRGPRVQVDRQAYSTAVRSMVLGVGVRLIEGQAVGFLGGGSRVEGVTLEDGGHVRSSQTVLSAGTFLGGQIHTGNGQAHGGRSGERASTALLFALQHVGMRFGRFKTGTPPRLDGRTIDWARLDTQPGDDDPVFLSSLTRAAVQPQVSCALTRTNARTHALIHQFSSSSPASNGAINARGPRHCPSIEDKVRRFESRPGHQIFVEPEALNDNANYPNGISMAFPAHVQIEILRTVAGFEAVQMKRAGYAVEYAYCVAGQIQPTLEAREIRGLFLAGQINGTTGYEEAAGQGVIAGMNAALASSGGQPIAVARALGYLGVLTSDIASARCSDPYRIFTARAEHRLKFGIETAEARFFELGKEVGATGFERRNRIAQTLAEVTEARDLLKKLVATPAIMQSVGFGVMNDGSARTAYDWLSLPQVNWDDCARVWPETARIGNAVRRILEPECRYAPYVARDERRASKRSMGHDDRGRRDHFNPC